VSLPYQRRLDPDPAELEAALRAERVAAVRFPALARPGWPSGTVACFPAGYSLQRVAPKRRRQVRRGLDACDEIRALDPDELLAEGLALNLDTMARQRRFDPELGEPARWRRFVAAVRACPAVTAAGAFHRGRLSSYDVFCRDGAWLHALYKMSRTEDLPQYTNIALDFWLLSRAAADPSIEGVWSGFVSMLPDPLHRLKLELGFEVLPHDLGIRFHPSLAPLLASRWTAAAAGALSRARPRDPRLELVAKHLAAAARTRRAAGAAP
jgi:hypothetical protein